MSLLTRILYVDFITILLSLPILYTNLYAADFSGSELTNTESIKENPSTSSSIYLFDESESSSDGPYFGDNENSCEGDGETGESSILISEEDGYNSNEQFFNKRERIKNYWAEKQINEIMKNFVKKINKDNENHVNEDELISFLVGYEELDLDQKTILQEYIYEPYEHTKIHPGALRKFVKNSSRLCSDYAPQVIAFTVFFVGTGIIYWFVCPFLDDSNGNLSRGYNWTTGNFTHFDEVHQNCSLGTMALIQCVELAVFSLCMGSGCLSNGDCDYIKNRVHWEKEKRNNKKIYKTNYENFRNLLDENPFTHKELAIKLREKLARVINIDENIMGEIAICLKKLNETS